jgi:hypothetical protein
MDLDRFGRRFGRHRREPADVPGGDAAPAPAAAPEPAPAGADEPGPETPVAFAVGAGGGPGVAPAGAPAGPQVPAAAPTPAEDIDGLPAWLEARLERAAIAQHCGGLSRAAADALAAALHPDPDETRPDWCGQTAAELMAAAGPDWPEIANRPEVLAALALAVTTSPGGVPVGGCPALAAAGGPAAEPEPAAPVTCGSCEHFRRNLIEPKAGLGYCRIEAPASRRPPSLWPNARHLCERWQRRADL